MWDSISRFQWNLDPISSTAPNRPQAGSHICPLAGNGGGAGAVQNRRRLSPASGAEARAPAHHSSDED